MDAWNLPTSLNLSGVDWQIRTDYRAILDILKYFNDPEYEDVAWEIALRILYINFEEMPQSIYEEACKKALEFIDAGNKDNGRKHPKTMDWEQDAPIIIPAINRVVGKEIRAMEYMHWWTFLGAYMEIGESTFSNIVNIRTKKAKGKKLDEWEKQFYRENKHMVDLERKHSAEEQAKIDRLNKMLG